MRWHTIKYDTVKELYLLFHLFLERHQLLKVILMLLMQSVFGELEFARRALIALLEHSRISTPLLVILRLPVGRPQVQQLHLQPFTSGGQALVVDLGNNDSVQEC